MVLAESAAMIMISAPPSSWYVLFILLHCHVEMLMNISENFPVQYEQHWCPATGSIYWSSNKRNVHYSRKVSNFIYFNIYNILIFRYNWFRFGIVTSHIAGHQDFLQKVRERCGEERRRFIIQEEFMVSEATNYDVSDIPKSEVRIILLYCTQAEAKIILANGAKVMMNEVNWNFF